MAYRLDKIRILMLCLGNICRSPTARGMLDKLIKDKRLDDLLKVDSAGTVNFHVSEAPDNRATEAALAKGYDLSQQRARQNEAPDPYWSGSSGFVLDLDLAEEVRGSLIDEFVD